MKELCKEARDIFLKQMNYYTADQLGGLELYAKHGNFDSPIEQILFAALTVERIFGYGPCKMLAQVKEGPYRIDIAAYYKYGDNEYKVAIECDGHNFHEKTEAQARRDKKKDRHLQANGWLVARFTGKQIKDDPIKCCDDITEMVTEIDVNDWMKTQS